MDDKQKVVGSYFVGDKVNTIYYDEENEEFYWETPEGEKMVYPWGCRLMDFSTAWDKAFTREYQDKFRYSCWPYDGMTIQLEADSLDTLGELIRAFVEPPEKWQDLILNSEEYKNFMERI